MRKRIAVLEKSKCNPHNCGNYLCIKLCPMNRAGKECIIKKGEKVAIDEEICNGCGICQNRCIFQAIHVVNLPEQLNAEPIHRFGENGFVLYRTPAPRDKGVVGIIGKNGIGKSTALQILSGKLMPNLGKENPEDPYKELIKQFRGTELQKYFEKLQNKEIKTSYKPQMVDKIPDIFKGKVKEFLKQFDETKKSEQYCKQLEIDNLMDRKLSELSGGELQRVAIVAASIKDANVYYFDEPSSYLDIKQRLKVANFIRKLSEKNSVMVIEHDLILLDYMADYIHIMYGQESCYGVVSNIMPARAGINSYLEGYIKSENIRFRNQKIEFDVKTGFKPELKNKLAEWNSFTKTYSNKFNLKAEKGILHSNETIGIVGENGIGKTTFAKIIAGEEKPDKEKLDLNLKISYKPQYIKPEKNTSVEEFLKTAITKYKNQLITPLKIDVFTNKKLSELSGGELQRVFIAKCLSEEADIYLLDEPSAYLDVEQRLAASKIIDSFIQEKGKGSLIIDHDLLFIDYISHSLLNFEGEPGKEGKANKILSMEEGMNKLLKKLKITLRRDKETKRPRVNKKDSVKDKEQKKSGKYYYL